MKDYWKKLLCALAIIPCTTLAVGCNDSNNNNGSTSGETSGDTTGDTSGDTTGGDTSGGTTGGESTGGGTTGGEQLTPEEQLAQEKTAAYTTLNTHAKALNNSSTASFHMVGFKEETMSVAFDDETFIAKNAELLESSEIEIVEGEPYPEAYNELVADFKAGDGEQTEKTKGVYGYNGATAEGYSLGYVFMGDADTGDYVQDSGLYTKKVGDNLRQYTYQKDGGSDTKMVQYVGDDYAEYGYHSYLEELSIDDLAKYSTLEDLKTSMVNNLINVFAGLFDLEADAEDFDLNIDLEKEGTDWKLVCDISSKEPFMLPGEFLDEEFAGMTIGLSMENNMFITFNSTGIKSASSVQTMEILMEMEIPGMVIPTKIVESISNTSTLENAIDNNILTNTDFEGFDGTGEEGAIEKVKGNIYYTLLQDDETIGQMSAGEPQDFGTDITLSTVADAAEEMWTIAGANNADYTEWYLDRECTIPAGEITKYPSYDMRLYAKATPKANAVQLNTYLTDGDEMKVNETARFVVPTGETVDLSSYYAGGFGDCYELDGIYVNGSTTPLTGDSLTVEAGEIYDVECRFKLKANAIKVNYKIYDTATSSYIDGTEYYPQEMLMLGTKLTEDDPAVDGDQTTYSVDLSSLLSIYPSAELCDENLEPLEEEANEITIDYTKAITVVVTFSSQNE